MDLNEAYSVLGVSADTALIQIKNSYEEALKQCPKTSDENKVKRKLMTKAYETILLNQDMDRDFDLMWKHKQGETKSVKVPGETYKTFIYSLITVLVLLNLIPYIGGWVSRFQGISSSKLFAPLNQNQLSSTLFDNPTADYELGYQEGATAAINLSKDVTFSISQFNISNLKNWYYIEDGDAWTVIIPLKVESSNQEKALINAKQFKLGEWSAVTDIKENIHLNEKLNSIYYLGPFDTALPVGTTFGLVFTVPPFENNEKRLLTYVNGMGEVQEISSLQFNKSGDDDLWKVNMQLVNGAFDKTLN